MLRDVTVRIIDKLLPSTVIKWYCVYRSKLLHE